MIVQGDALEVLATLPDEFVDCVITSPPYWGLRAYQTNPQIWDGKDGCEHVWGDEKTIRVGRNDTGDIYNADGRPRAFGGQKAVESSNGQFCSLCGAWRGELGLEPTFQLYLDHLMQIMAKCKRVLKKTGTMWINLSDTFASSNMNSNQSLSSSRVLSCDSDDKEQSGLIENGHACYHYDGELQDGCQNHQNCIFRNEKQHQQCALHSVLISRDNGRWDSVSSFLDVFSRVVQESTNLSLTGNAQVAFSQEGKVLVSLFEVRSYFYDDSLSSSKDEYISGIFQMLLPSDCHIRDKALSFLASQSPYGLISNNITNMYQTVKPKSLVGIPERFAIRMTDDLGLIRRNTIIWYKRNCMPSSVKDRFTVDFEYVYFFTKSGKYWFEQQKEKGAGNKWGKYSNPKYGDEVGTMQTSKEMTREEYLEKYEERNRRCVWDVPTKPFSGAHFAVFPPGLVEPMLSAGCPPDGWVIDPFAGSGTVGMVAKQQSKNFIGIELNPEYVTMAEERIDHG